MSGFRAPAFLSLTLALACTSVPEADDEAGVTTSPSTGEDVDTDSSTTSTSTGTTSTDTTSTGTTGTTTDDLDTTDGNFIAFGDFVGEQCMCDTFSQDCTEGEKCVPYSSQGDTWDCVKCVPVVGGKAVGESCTYDGALASNDDCDDTSWCWDPDLDGNGTCHAFCGGSADVPMCPSMLQCWSSDNGAINLCVSACDPIIQGCPEGEACYWDGDSFGCIITTEDIPVGEPCGLINDCALGNICVDAAAVPGCSDAGCCTNFCELGLGDSQCASLPGTLCVPFFEMGQAPDGYEHVGLCVLSP